MLIRRLIISEVGSSNWEVNKFTQSLFRRRYPPLEGAGGGCRKLSKIVIDKFQIKL
jgi:hypothetical protein